ncbi:hypothetical protein FEE95_18450 [Maribacter algarum]|uniref:SGNH/GDSL hydrolase family protein n=1 Tax=Maribacter algarum (ex Zhang et al. 2020) TaxID=2578118 RepID=A0A5S3PHY1_9FLAO|nr:hypothetical protein [Maribacter algarum]TMM53878.1 hypothetical protein FEE95_18450 [Maribacter algarum]
MKDFIKRILLFLVPLIIYVSLALYIDPYNVLRKETNPKLLELKLQISSKLNYRLYKLKEYSDQPKDIIFLGDSRTNRLKVKIVDSLKNMSSSNLAYAGATLPEIIETFWYINKIHKLKEIYIGVNFNLYNKKNSMNMVTEAIDLKKSPLSYLFSQSCFKSTFYILKSLVTKQKIDIEKPRLDKAEFWRYQLESTANNFYRDYNYPNGFFIQLSAIAEYCDNNNIKLVFFIPPTHVDLQQKVEEFELLPKEHKFKSDLSKLGLFYDFDYPNKLTKNNNNFLDPFHFNDSIANIIVHEIVTGNVNYARIHVNEHK